MSHLDHLMKLLGRLPGLGPRSGRRVALHLIKRKESHLMPLVEALSSVAQHVKACITCGNLDEQDICAICQNPKRDRTRICVIQDVDDLWALERTGSFKGYYHVLGGVLSALDGIGPQDLRLQELKNRLENTEIEEIILALGATVDGETTCHYIQDMLKGYPLQITRLAYGVPMGGELDYLDDGTITAAINARRVL